MKTLTLANLDDQLLNILRQRALQHGQSLEDEAKTILTAVLKPTDPWASIDEIRQRIAAAGRQRTDSALLLREDRDR